VGNSLARRWRAVAYWHFVRTRGRDTLDTLRPWLQLAFIGGASTKIMGFSTGQSLKTALALILGSELLMFLLGVMDHRAGVIERQMVLNNSQDPWKMETLAILRRLDRLESTGDTSRNGTTVPWQTADRMTPT
jgi:hypothetical protein